MDNNDFGDAEARDLETHVLLCAERYDTLNDKLDNLEKRTSNIENMIRDISTKLFLNEDSRLKFWLKVSGYIIGSLVALVVGLSAYNFQRIDRVHDQIQKSEKFDPKNQRPDNYTQEH